jgi:hypothetical protein
MAKYNVSIWWETEVEAEDEGFALEEAYNKFDFWDKADLERVEDYEGEEN